MFGVFSLFLYNFSIGFLRESFAPLREATPFQILFLQSRVSEIIGAVIVRDILFVISIIVIYFLVDALLKGYTIGLAEKLSRSGGVKLSDGLQSVSRAASLFGKNIVIFLLLLFGFFLLGLTTAVLLGKLALFAFIPAAIIYVFILYSVSFFASQSIVVEKKGPWDGIASSYIFIKKNLEDVAQLILFIIFVYVAFHVIRLSSLRLFEHFFAGITMRIISIGGNLLLGYIMMRPYFIIL